MTQAATACGPGHYCVVPRTGTECHEVTDGGQRSAASMDDLTEMLKGTLEGCVLQILASDETYG
jgi:hypothetical protein